MYNKKLLTLFCSTLLLLNACGGGSGDDFQLRNDSAKDALNKIILYADTEGVSSAPSVEDYSLAGVAGVTSENLTLLNKKISKSGTGGTNNPSKIEKILKNQDFDGDSVKDRLDNCPLIANTGQTDSNNDGVGDACDTEKPVVTDTTVPVVTDTTEPVVTDTTEPVVTDTTEPVVTDTTVPVVTETDIIAPEITIVGANPLSLNVGESFSDPGAKAIDDVDGDLTQAIQQSSNVNTAVAGTYTVNYSVSDTAGNDATAKRSVIVGVETLPPEVTTVSASSSEMTLGSSTGSVPADGTKTLVIVTVKDSQGNIILPAIVSLNQNGGSATISDPFIRNGNTYAFVISTTTPEQIIFIATANGVIINDTETLTFTGAAPVPQVIGGITIQNSVDILWEDMNGQNTGWVSNMPNGYLQFQGPNKRDINANADHVADRVNSWLEVEAAGDGGHCSADMNSSTNTEVEVGWTRFYYLMNDNSWVLARETKDFINGGNGSQNPSNSSATGTPRENDRCNPYTSEFKTIREADPLKGSGTYTKVAGEFVTTKPEFYWRFHAWTSTTSIDLSQVKGLFATTYMRLVVKDPSKPDDRHLANYVAHMGSDIYKFNSSTGGKDYVNDTGIGRYKKITNDWQPINFYSGSWATKAELAANPPPFTSP